jgi:hypothetical protein
MLDAQVKQEYRRRLRELREELEELRQRGHHDRGEKVDSEIDFIEREIVRAVGLGGRDRRAGSVAERARLNVTRAIKSALQKIAEHHAALGELLEGSSVFAPMHLTSQFQLLLRSRMHFPKATIKLCGIAAHYTDHNFPYGVR